MLTKGFLAGACCIGFFLAYCLVAINLRDDH
jgi:hypothetical protein